MDIFTDGSCDLKKNIGGYGIYFPNKEYKSYGIKMIEKKHKKITNQRAELYAILEVFKILKENINQKEKKINIYSDSMYSINCLTVWRYNWEKNNWINSKKEPVLNQDIIKDCIKLYNFLIDNGFTINFYHVNSHKNIKEYKYICNNIVDKLSRTAANLENNIEEIEYINEDEEENKYINDDLDN